MKNQIETAMRRCNDPGKLQRIEAAVNSLTAAKCVCGADKGKGWCFCKPCYYALPAETRRALWKQVTHGFEDAYAAAVKWLADHRAKAGRA